MRSRSRWSASVVALVAAALVAVAIVTAMTVVPSSPERSSASPAPTPMPTPTPTPTPTPRTTPAGHEPAVRRTANPALSPAQLAGQRIVYAYPGLTPPPSLLTAIRAGEAAGVILFAPNVGSRAQVRGVTRQLQAAAAASPIHAPLLIMTDQEGGQVRRLPGAPSLSERQIGASQDGAALARQAGTGAGQNLAGAGININLSPVLDVVRRPGNFIDEFARAYSGNAQTVARLSSAFIAAQQRTGVAATAKHFPGLGAAAVSQNTDLQAVTLGLPLSQLRNVDESPYRSAIAAGVRLVMTSWARYPALDRKLPAGLSSIVLQGELRGRLGFRGVTISDTISATSLTQFGSLAQRGVLVAGAGADLIICSALDPSANRPGIGTAVLRGIASALTDGRLGRGPAQQAAARVLNLRRRL